MMHLKNLKIGTQLKLGLAAMLLVVIALGTVSYIQSEKIRLQTETMYDHPFLVRHAIGVLKADILIIHRNMKDLFLTSNENEIAMDLNQIEISKTSAFEEITTLYDRYLGPRCDIDSLKWAFITWNSLRDETIRLLRSGKIREGITRTQTSGVAGKQAEVLFTVLQKVDDFAKNKSDDLYTGHKELTDFLNKQLVLFVVTLLVISILIHYLLLRNIRKPLEELTRAAECFRNGDMNSRCSYVSLNELGILSASFNTLAESIQISNVLDEKVAHLTGLMLSEYDVKKFFQATLNALAAHTGSQMAAIYLLSEDKKVFDHFESVGVDHNARQSFAADCFEGEFGSVLFSSTVQHLKNIPENTRFVFYTVSGAFIPHEIVTIPILVDHEVSAIISLASVTMYSKQSIQLINTILGTLSSRIEGIMAYHKMEILSKLLEHQNCELVTQQTELASQTADLIEQNTELEIQKKQLDEASRLKTNFLSNMSHELRTPLNSVIALSGVLNRRLVKKIPEEEYSYLEVIQRNGKHLLSLINDILDISRIEAGHEEIEITRFNSNNLVAEVVNMIHPQAKQKNIELLHTNNDSNISITSDVDKCQHILQNLIGNAVKFTERGKVVVTVRQTEKVIEIAVTDTGIGISEDHLPHIFDEFRQADGSTSRKFGGTGLGLAIAKKYTRLLGGSISVKSIPGQGSEFTLILPLHYTTENRILQADTAIDFNSAIKPIPGKSVSGLAGLAGLAGKTILLVEDSEPAIIQIKDFLEGSGFHILVAHHGAEALGIISQTIPDAMILDLMLPGIDGFDVLKTLRQSEPAVHIPVLILSAKHITREELDLLKRNNIHQLIQKGDVNRNELLNAVTKMVFPEPKEIVKPQRTLQVIDDQPLVLVVEDNPDNMIAVKALLGDNYKVVETVDAQEGIKMAKKYKPNLILMDIALPGMDGIEAFTAIRNCAELQHIPVIALTASAMTSDREAILAHGFDAYIAKPIDEYVFFKTIKEILYGQ